MPDPTPDRWRRVRDVFDAVADLPAAERPAALDDACRTSSDEPDPALRAEVQVLLDADVEGSFLDAPAADGAAALVEEETDTAQGARFGPWRVVEEIGRGGMGAVYLVERADGVYDQRAALKRLVLSGADRARRFEQERQILAGLDHPGIARLLDGGVASDGEGAPYLVMEYVEGVPITRYADAHGLDVAARVRLFAQVCDAVGHAHRHLVVHRDLKPSNVLVAEADGRVKLLDFGIAKLLEGTDGAELTGTGFPLLTPEYAAPEQVTGETVTTATDVYALGVLLYELLSGQRPYEIARGTLTGIVEAVRDTEPRPASAAADEGRRRALRGDLDTIVAKALDKAPARRYGSADELADDLRRHLDGLPVEARTPTAVYRAQRFARRHRVGVAAAVLLALVLVGGIASTLWQARQTRIAAAESTATAAFLSGLFQGADPTATGDSLLALDLLERGAQRIEADLADQPGVRASLYLTVGDAYLGLGQADSAAVFARRALAARRPGGPAPDAEAAVRARLLLGRALFATNPTQAGAELADAVAQARDVGDDALLLDALEAQGRLVGSQVLAPAETVAVLEEAVALCRRLEGDESPRLGRLLATLALKASSAQQHGRSEGLLREALDRLPAASAPYDRSAVLLDLASQLHATGQADEAQVMADEALAIRRRLLGPDDVRTAEALAARARVGGGGPEAAERDAREALRIAERAGDGAVTIDVLNALGSALTDQGRHDEAVEVYRRRFVLAGEIYGTEGTRYPAASATVARALHRGGRYEEAARAWDESIRLSEPAYGPESAVVVSLLLSAGETARAAGRPAQAAQLYERAFTASRSLPRSSKSRASAALHFGRVLLDRGRASEALGPLRSAFDARDALDRPGHDTASEGDLAEALLGEALVATGTVEAGLPLLVDSVPALADALGDDHPDVRRARAALDAAGLANIR